MPPKKRKDFDPATLLLDAVVKGKNDNGYSMGFNRPDVSPAAMEQGPPQGPRMNTLGPGGNAAGNSQSPGGGFDWQAQLPYAEPSNEQDAMTANSAIWRMGSHPTNFQEYKDAARLQQLASGQKGVADLPAWNGPGNPVNTNQQVAYAETLQNLQANKSLKMREYENQLAQRKARAIANNASGIRPSDNSREAGLDRLLLAELTKGGASPMGAVAGLQQANGPAGGSAFGGMSPTMQNIFAMRHPDAYAHIAGQRPDLTGQAAVMTAQGQLDMMKNNPGALVPGFAEVDMKKKAQDAFDKGKLPPENWAHFTPVLSQLVPPAYKYGFASSRKKDAMASIKAQYPNIDETQLSAWYDSQYGKPWTN